MVNKTKQVILHLCVVVLIYVLLENSYVVVKISTAKRAFQLFDEPFFSAIFVKLMLTFTRKSYNYLVFLEVSNAYRANVVIFNIFICNFWLNLFRLSKLKAFQHLIHILLDYLSSVCLINLSSLPISASLQTCLLLSNVHRFSPNLIHDLVIDCVTAFIF